MREKKIRKAELDEITYEDVCLAIERWDSDEELNVKKQKYDSKEYFLFYKGRRYPSKPIFAVAYESHYGKAIKTTNLNGGFSNESCVAAQLQNRLKFEIISKKDIIKQEKDIDNMYIEQINELLEIEIPGKENYNPIPEPRKELVECGKNYSYPRSKSTALKALARADFQCECQKNDVHPGFLRKTNGKNYTEPHHIIPLSEQECFINNLDVQANIVSLCSNCHNQLHYGTDPVPLLTHIYNKRKEELKLAGISVSFKKLISFYI